MGGLDGKRAGGPSFFAPEGAQIHRIQTPQIAICKVHRSGTGQWRCASMRLEQWSFLPCQKRGVSLTDGCQYLSKNASCQHDTAGGKLERTEKWVEGIQCLRCLRTTSSTNHPQKQANARGLASFRAVRRRTTRVEGVLSHRFVRYDAVWGCVQCGAYAQTTCRRLALDCTARPDHSGKGIMCKLLGEVQPTLRPTSRASWDMGR